MPEYADSDDDDMDLPGAVPSNRKGALRAQCRSRRDQATAGGRRMMRRTTWMMKSPWIPKLSAPSSSFGTRLGRYIKKQRKKKALNTKLKALDMKSRMRDAFAEPSYIATASWALRERPFRSKEHYRKTGCAQHIARSVWFEHTTMPPGL